MENEDYLKIAVEQAKKSFEEGGFPAGAVLIKDGKIISRGISIGAKSNDPTGHSETSAIREACEKLGTTDLGGAVLYSSMQPCMMCFSVGHWANISKIVYGCKKTDEMVERGYYEGRNDIEVLNEKNNRKIEIKYVSDFEEEIEKLIKKWEENL